MIRKIHFVRDDNQNADTDTVVQAGCEKIIPKSYSSRILPLCLTGTAIVVSVMASSGTSATSTMDSSNTIATTALSAAVSSGIKQNFVPADTYSEQLAQVTQVSVESTGGHNNELLLSRTHELMMVDEREVDEVAARLKEIIRARYEADNLNLQTMTTVDDLRKRIAEFEKLLENADSEQKKLLTQKSDLQKKVDRIAILEDKVANKEADYAGLKGKYNNLLAESDNARQESEGVLKALNDKQRQLVDLKRQLGDLTSERDNALTQLASVERGLDEKNNLIDELNRRINGIGSQRDQAKDALVKLKSNYRQADALANNLLAERDNLAGTVSLFENKADDVNHALENEKQHHAQTRSLAETLESDLDELQAELVRLGKEKESLVDEKAHLQATSKNLGNSLARVEGELDTKQNELQSAQATIDELNTRVGSLSTERDAANAQVESLKVEMAALNDKFALAEEQTENRVESADEELSVLRETLAAEVALRDNSLQDQADQLSVLDSTLQQRNAEIAEKERLIKSLEDQISELESSKARVLANKVEGDLMIGELESELVGLVSSRDSAAQQVDQLRAGNNKLSARLEDTSRALGAVKKQAAERLAKLKDRVKRLQASGVSADQQIEQLSAVNEDLKADVKSTRQKIEIVSAKGSDQVKQLMARVDDLENLVADLQSREADLNGRIKVFTQAGNGLLDQLEISQQSHRGAQKGISELRDSVSDYQAKLEIANKKLTDLALAEQLAEEERDAVVAESEALRKSLTGELNKARLEHITVQKARADNSIPLRLGNADFFAPGSAVLTKQGGENLIKLMSIIQSHHDRRIVVEGHTDNVPIGAALTFRFQSNWELSVARAAAAVRHMQKNTDIDPTQLSAAGYGEYRPVSPNDTADGRQQNRRVEVVLYPRSDQYNNVDPHQSDKGVIESYSRTLTTKKVDFRSENSSVSSLEE